MLSEVEAYQPLESILALPVEILRQAQHGFLLLSLIEKYLIQYLRENIQRADFSHLLNVELVVANEDVQ